MGQACISFAALGLTKNILIFIRVRMGSDFEGFTFLKSTELILFQDGTRMGQDCISFAGLEPKKNIII